MKVTQELIAGLGDGQIEIFNLTLRDRYCGRFDSVKCTADGRIWVVFKWLAMDVNFPRQPAKWIANTSWDLEWSARAGRFTAQGIGEGRIRFASSIGGETVIFFPRSHANCLDPSHIEGIGLPVVSTR